MDNKVWYKTEIVTDIQFVSIYPTEEYDGIVLETSEMDNSSVSRLYLHEKEMVLLIIKMREMMEYVKSNSDK
jgi:hypothetical protein